MVFYDFEVFKHDWLVVLINPDKRTEEVIVNDEQALTAYYEANKEDIWTGYNSNYYDQFILRGIMCGFNPKKVNDWIIVKQKSGWQFSSMFYKIPLLSYDVMLSSYSLKQLEGFMGNAIKETSVPFDIDRKLTDAEIAETVKYCKSDVYNTIEVFMQTLDDFKSKITLIKQFELPLKYISKTKAQLAAEILGCKKTPYNDEFDFIIEDYIELRRYKHLYNWFVNMKTSDKNVNPDEFYSNNLECIISGVEHKIGWGGIHGAKKGYHFRTGKGRLCFHVDVTSYYPSYLIARNRITRSAKYPERYKWSYEYQKDLKKQGKKAERLPYKLFLNSLSGAMKDKTNKAYDPCMNNTMVVNCQLSAIMLIEMLEVIPGFELVQSNTDGLIVTIPDTDEAFEMLDNICYEWERICSTDEAWVGLEFEEIEYIYQKDVNNYLFKLAGSDKIVRIGQLKHLSELDNNLPIITTAIVNYLTKGISPETTILFCDDLKQFQMICKISSKYKCLIHNGKPLTEKCVRVFASKNNDGGLYKLHQNKNKPDKFPSTPENCFIVNDDVNDMSVPAKLDRQFYINMAKERLSGYGIG